MPQGSGFGLLSLIPSGCVETLCVLPAKASVPSRWVVGRDSLDRRLRYAGVTLTYGEVKNAELHMPKDCLEELLGSIDVPGVLVRFTTAAATPFPSGRDDSEAFAPAAGYVDEAELNIRVLSNTSCLFSGGGLRHLLRQLNVAPADLLRLWFLGTEIDEEAEEQRPVLKLSLIRAANNPLAATVLDSDDEDDDDDVDDESLSAAQLAAVPGIVNVRYPGNKPSSLMGRDAENGSVWYLSCFLTASESSSGTVYPPRDWFLALVRRDECKHVLLRFALPSAAAPRSGDSAVLNPDDLDTEAVEVNVVRKKHSADCALSSRPTFVRLLKTKPNDLVRFWYAGEEEVYAVGSEDAIQRPILKLTIIRAAQTSLEPATLEGAAAGVPAAGTKRHRVDTAGPAARPWASTTAAPTPVQPRQLVQKSFVAQEALRAAPHTSPTQQLPLNLQSRALLRGADGREVTGARLTLQWEPALLSAAGMGRLLSQYSVSQLGAVDVEEYELEGEQGVVQFVLRLVQSGRTDVLEEAIADLLGRQAAVWGECASSL